MTTLDVASARSGRPPWLAGCDPTVLLAVVVAVPLVLTRTFDPRPLAVLWVLAAVAAMTVAGVRPVRLALLQLPFVSFGLSLLVVNAVTRDGVVLAAWGPFEVTGTGLAMGAGLAVRTLLVGLCASAFLAVCDPVRLLGSLHQVGRLPVRVSCALLAAYRLLDDLPAEWESIRRAHAVREVAPRRFGVQAAGRAAFVLLVTSIRRAERISTALESRALGALPRAERTVWRPASVGRRDGVLVAAVAGALLAVPVVAGPLLGT